MDIKFGTDGIRAEVNKGLTPEIAYKVGSALALFLKEKVNKRVLVARDTRKSCDMLMCALSSGLMSQGVDVHFASYLPTPALSYLTKKFGYDAGVMITASHNTHNYNGIKIFNEDGLKYKTSQCLELENISRQNNKFVHFTKVGEFTHVNLAAEYIKLLKNKLKKCSFKICFDCANGVTSLFAKKIFSKLDNVSFISTSCESELVNVKCGATDIKKLSHFVKGNQFDVGFAFDGDGDRVIAVDEKGECVDGDELLYIIARDFLARKKLKKKVVVGTVMTNYGVQASLADLGIMLIREQVGDKYIQHNMIANGYSVGGEQSGHIIINGSNPTGDGMLVACEVLNIMRRSNKSLHELKSLIKKFPQKKENVVVSPSKKEYVINNEEVKDLVSKCENELAGYGRVLVRASGTENLIRVLVEGENSRLVNGINNKIVKKIKEVIQHC